MPEGQKPAEEKVVPVLKDILSALDIVASNRYMTLENQNEIDIYVTYITYRVQQDLFQMCQECGLFRDLEWDDFVLLMGRYEQATRAFFCSCSILNPLGQLRWWWCAKL